MADEYQPQYFDFSVPQSSGENLSSEERRLLTLRNFAMSKAAKAGRKKKLKRTEPKEKKITEAERRLQEQARIREERETRRARSEENRRQAAIGAASEPPADSLLPKQPELPEKKLRAENAEPDIDIAIPPENTGKPKKTKNSSKQKKTSSNRTAPASRYARAQTTYQNRITTGGAITLGILTGVLIGTVIYGRVQTNEIYTNIAALQSEYDDLVAKNIGMRSEMEGKMTVKNIEEYAEDVLGLMPLNQSQIEYIQLQTEDEVVISEPEDNFFVTINDYLVSIWEFLRGK